MKLASALRIKWRTAGPLRRWSDLGGHTSPIEETAKVTFSVLRQKGAWGFRSFAPAFMIVMLAAVTANFLFPVEAIAASGPTNRYSLKALDLSRAPSDEELIAAGQLGGPLDPTHVARNKKKHNEMNLSFGRAIEKWNRHEYREAVKLFRRYADEYPDSPWTAEAKLHIGCDATYNGRYAEAEDNFVSIIEANTGSREKGAKSLVNKARLRLGVLKMNQGDFDNAASYFAQLHAGSKDWRDKTYASNWLRQLSVFQAQRTSLLNCGVLALAQVLEKEGKLSDAKLVSGMVPHSPKGFNVEDLKVLAEGLGYSLSPLRISHDDLKSLSLPAIAQLSGRNPGETGHYWVLEKLGEEGLTIFDPQSGQRFVQNENEFSRQWNGVVLAFSSNEDLPGIRLTSEETGSLYGGCCGNPRPSSGLGTPPKNAIAEGNSGKGCPLPSAKGAPIWQVNMVNMNLFVTDTPLWYENTIGPSVEITLSYNAQSAIARYEPFGNKWQFNYASYLIVDSAGQVTVYMPDGRRDAYTPNGSGGYVPPAQVHNALTRTSGSHFELRFPDDTVYVYDVPAGTMSQQSFLVEIRDAYGQSLTFGYDGAPGYLNDVRLSTITDASGRVTQLIYGTNGLASLVTDPFGRSASFQYDSNGNLVKITDMGGYWTSFSYDANVYLTAVTRPNGVWSFYIEPADGINNGSNGYPAPGGTMWQSYRITITDPLGGKEEYHYNGDAKSAWYVSPTAYVPYSSSGNNAAGSVAKTTYNYTTVQGKGKVSTITYPGAGTRQFGYDSSSGEILSSKDQNGKTTTFTYNDKGMVTSRTDPNGQVTRLTYASNGVDPIEIDNGFGAERRTYDGTHNLTSVTDRLGKTKSFVYNQYGSILTSTDALGNTIDFSYDNDNRVVQIAQGQTVLGTFSHDDIGRITSKTDAAGLTLDYSYNDLDNPVRVLYPDGTSEDTIYSVCCPHLVESVTDRAGKTTLYSYNPLKQQLTQVTYPGGAILQYGYDANMNRTSATDPNGNAVTYTYDPMNRMTQQADPKGNVTTFSYDSNGNRLTMTDAAGKITRFTYDSMNRLASLTDPAGAVTSYTRDLRGLVTLKTDPLNKNTNLVYDAEERLTNYTDRNGVALIHAYNPTGKLSSITYPDGSQVTMAYDAMGRLTEMHDPLGTSSYTHDAAGRLTNYTDANGFTLGYTYDQFGNATQLTYPDGTIVTYGYDVLNRLATVTEPQGDTASYTYDIAGSLDIFTHFNGIITTYSHDAANRLLGMGSIVSDYQFTLDVNGNRIHSYQNEPLSASRAAASISYGYNTKKNRLLSAGSTSYAYDNEGQLSTAGSTAYAFDYDHRLAGIGSDAQFTYDGGGNRLSATRAGLTTRYIYDPWGNLLAEADASNQITRKYIHGKGLIALVTPTDRYCYHFNGTGHTIALTDMTGTVVNSYAYESFGQILAEQEAIAQPFKYVGQFGVMAEPSGFYYMRARYYDPSVGRFISEDPIGFGGGDVNLYAYTRNNPVNAIDPFGLFDEKVHELLTYNVLTLAGASQPLINKAVAGNLSVDDWSNQLNNNQHGMRDVSQHGCDAQAGSSSFRESRLQQAVLAAKQGDVNTSMLLLGQGLHNVQDEVAHGFIIFPEHANPQYIYRDIFPLRSSMIEAEARSAAYVDRYLRMMGKTGF